jgi:hypothetical protein
MNRPYELFARWNPQGHVAGVSVRTITTIDGKDYENDPEPLAGTTDPAFVEFADLFSADVVAERDSLAAAKAELEAQLATLTTERDSLVSQLAAANATITERDTSIAERDATITAQSNAIAETTSSLNLRTTERDALVAQLNESSAALTLANTRLETANATTAALQERVDRLLVELPFDPRIIDAQAFYDRISKDEFATLSTSEDPQLVMIAKKILQYKDPINDWPVIFDSNEFQSMFAYVVAAGVLTPARLSEITRDATREEAYTPRHE